MIWLQYNFAIYQPLCRNILQKFSRAICDILQYTEIYCNTIFCFLCMLYIYCRFIFRSTACAEKLFSHCKYIKIETHNRLTPQLFEAINFWNVIENFGKVHNNWSHMRYRWVQWKIFAHMKEWKKMKPKKREWTETIINNKINIAYYIELNYTNWKH